MDKFINYIKHHFIQCLIVAIVIYLILFDLQIDINMINGNESGFHFRNLINF